MPEFAYSKGTEMNVRWYFLRSMDNSEETRYPPVLKCQLTNRFPRNIEVETRGAPSSQRDPII